MSSVLDSAPVVSTDPETMGGTPVFPGTRVPIKALMDYIEGDYKLEEFLDHFPTVSREKALAFLERAFQSVN